MDNEQSDKMAIPSIGAQAKDGRIVWVDQNGVEHELDIPCLRYVPMPKQKLFHINAGKKLISIYHGGNKGGKSHALLWHCCAFGEGINIYMEKKPPVCIWLSVLDYNMIEQYVRPRLEGVGEWAGKGFFSRLDGQLTWAWHRTDYYYECMFTGSRLFIKSADAGATKYEGASVDLMAFDEEQPEAIMKAGLLRTLDATPRGHVIVTATHKLGKTWFWFDWIVPAMEGRDPDIFEVLASPRENVHINQDEVERIARKLTKWEKATAIDGLPLDDSENSPFDPANIKLLLERCREGKRAKLFQYDMVVGAEKYIGAKMIYDGTSPMEVWEDVQPSEEYVIVGDPSEGYGNDESVWQVWKRRNAELVCEWAMRRVDMVEYVKAGILMARYYNGAYMVFLRRGIGAGLTDFIYQQYQNMHRSPDGKIGFTETRDTKESMIAAFNMRFDPSRPKIPIIPSKATITQFMNLQRIPTRTGASMKIEAAEGCCDDRCITALTALVFCEGGDALVGVKEREREGSIEWMWKKATQELNASTGRLGALEAWDESGLVIRR